jgi:uncharacterized protein with HEPN domain
MYDADLEYFDVDAEAVFNTCGTKIAPLAATVKKIIEDIVNGDSY